MKKGILLLSLFGLLLFPLFGQPTSIYNDDPNQKLPIGVEKPTHGFIEATGKTTDQIRLEPPFWFVGMNEPVFEILIYDQDIKDYSVSIGIDLGIKLLNVHKVENPNYLFLEIQVGPGAKAGQFPIVLEKAGKRKVFMYELRPRREGTDAIQGLTPADLIYLIMPDRFANGDVANDSFEDMKQVGINRDKMFFRHGGDLKGIMDRLDYIQDLGVTAIWLNPVLENNQPYESYHGYAITNHYAIDKRFGSNELYQEFVQKCHEKGLKVVMDIVPNHVGNEHWFIKDLPDTDWIHQWDEFTRPIYRSSLLMDPYASEAEKKQLNAGWFDHHMPDLNQQHPRLARYLIQSYIWWLEYSGQDSYRIDTYFYADQEFMASFAKRMQLEYPQLNMFGETWVQEAPLQAFFTENSQVVEGFNSHLPSVTDFQVHFALEEALTHKQEWNGGITRLYYTLAQDFLYEDPKRNILFLDNHDKSRFFSVVKEDINKYKSAIACLMTLRGTPSIYYGSELLFKNYADPDGKVRQDVPGGWAEDKVNKFSPEGRTAAEEDMFQYVRKLAQYRKATPALQTGKMVHFVPENGIYVYFRYDRSKTIMVIMNTHDKTAKLSTKTYAERMQGFKQARNVVSENVLSDLSSMEIPGNSTYVLELIP